jgi:hypothetical protein
MEYRGMTNIYDGNNVMLRRMTTPALPGQAKLSLRQLLAAAQPSDIWVWDGFNHNARRVAVYPPYKGQRKPPAENVFAQIQLFKKLLAHTPAVQVCVEGWEADDVIYSLVQRMGPVTVHSNDADYVQLSRFPNVTLKGPKAPKCDPRHLALYKALCGDSSDNITGIPGFGPGAWDKTEGYREELTAAIRAGDANWFDCLPCLSKSAKTWLAGAGNIEQLQAMFTIVHMWEVPADEIEKGLTVGTPNPNLIDSVLKQYFL